MKLFISAIMIAGLLSIQNIYGSEGRETHYDEIKWVFVGCSWGPGECAYSCPSLGTFKAEYDPKQCETQYPSEWACYCDAADLFEEEN